MPKTLEDYAEEARKQVKEVSPDEVDRMINEGGWVVLDVREPDEYAEGHIPGAINCSRGFLEVKADPEHHKRDERLQDRTQKFICYCGGGCRSLLAAKTMKEMGFQDAVSMTGGWKGWQDEGRAEEK
jgi:rhodanese-related sulfurtransferase